MNNLWDKYLISICLLIFLIFPQKILADENFDISYHNKYLFLNETAANVIQTTTLINKKTNLYPSSYEVVVFGNITGEVQAYDNTGNLKIEVTKEELNKSKIYVKFNEKSVGLGNQLIFTLNYTLTGLVNTYGRVKEITIPKVTDDPSLLNYQVEIEIPKNFGVIAYLKPKQQINETDASYKIIYDSKDAIRGVLIGIGDFAVYKFKINYHLKNNSLIQRKAEIALPPDTLYQQAIYSSINPPPMEVSIDKEGNWLASYELYPRQNLDIQANGTIIIQTQPLNSYKDIIPDKTYTNSNKYWEVNSTEVSSLKEKLKNPYDIYQYLTQTFRYNYGRVNLENQRMGAKEALKNPDKAICMEFTDSFITLSRSIGIAAREVNGYAYTTDEYLKPLSLIADVLHAWPEYWDSQNQTWIAVDPTWGNTTGGLDYFNSLDLNHIVFVRRGMSSTYPLAAGSYRLENISKDIEVTPEINLPRLDFKPLIFTVEIPKKIFAGKNQSLIIKITNPEGLGRHNIPLKIEADDFKIDLSENIINMPPYGEKLVNADIKYLRNNYWGKIPVTVMVGQEIKKFDVTIEPRELLIFVIYAVVFVILVILTYLIIRKNVSQKRTK